MIGPVKRLASLIEKETIAKAHAIDWFKQTFIYSGFHSHIFKSTSVELWLELLFILSSWFFLSSVELVFLVYRSIPVSLSVHGWTALSSGIWSIARMNRSRAFSSVPHLSKNEPQSRTKFCKSFIFVWMLVGLFDIYSTVIHMYQPADDT